MSLFTHWVCFNCQKSFHKLPNESGWKCPDCSKLMVDMGIYFEPPKRQAKKRWAIMKLLAENGYNFQTEGNKAYIESFIFQSKKPRIVEIKERIESEKSRKIL